jgi:hypothetical protein
LGACSTGCNRVSDAEKEGGIGIGRPVLNAAPGDAKGDIWVLTIRAHTELTERGEHIAKRNLA